MNPIFGFYGFGFYDFGSLFDRGSGINIHEITRARRKIHRAKMYKQYRGQRLRGHREKARH